MGAASSLAHESHRVAIIDHHKCAILIGEIANAFEIGDEAIHRKHAIGCDEFKPRVVRIGFLQFRFEVFEIVVLVAVTLGFAESHPVDD